VFIHVLKTVYASVQYKALHVQKKTRAQSQNIQHVYIYTQISLHTQYAFSKSFLIWYAQKVQSLSTRCLPHGDSFPFLLRKQKEKHKVHKKTSTYMFFVVVTQVTIKYRRYTHTYMFLQQKPARHTRYYSQENIERVCTGVASSLFFTSCHHFFESEKTI